VVRNRFIIFKIPADVTEEHIQEAFKENGTVEVEQITYKSQAESGHEDGGICFIKVDSYEAGEKFMESLEGEDEQNKSFTINGHVLQP